MLEIQKFLKEHPDNYKELLSEKPYAIKVTEDEKLGLSLFKYNQIDSDFNIPMVRECRGIILETSTWNIVCHPFHKFGNYGESYVPEIDWNSASVMSKIDGSLIKVYYWKGEWKIATNGTIDAFKCELPFPTDELKTFGEMVLKAFHKYGWYDFRNLDPVNTYLFEVVSPLNRVVVPYPEIDIYYLSTKNNLTGEETLDIDFLPKPKVYNLNSLDDCIEAAEKMPYSEEGYVVVDKYLNRLKIKSPAYVAVHRLRGESVPTPKRILDIIRMGEEKEFLNYFPEYKEEFDKIKIKYEQYLMKCIVSIEQMKEQTFENRKEAAMWIKKSCINTAICFSFLDGKIKNAKEGIDLIPTDKLVSYIGVK